MHGFAPAFAIAQLGRSANLAPENHVLIISSAMGSGADHGRQLTIIVRPRSTAEAPDGSGALLAGKARVRQRNVEPANGSTNKRVCPKSGK